MKESSSRRRVASCRRDDFKIGYRSQIDRSSERARIFAVDRRRGVGELDIE